MIRFNYSLIVFALCVSACSDSEDNTSSVKQSNKTFIDPQLQALEKAKGVEKQLLDAADQQRKLIDSQDNY